MKSHWRGIPALLILLTGLIDSVSSYGILEGPKNATVSEGSEARFNCTVSPGWMLIMWALNDMVVLSLTPKEPIITNNRFTSASYEVDGNFVSEMIIQDVQLSDAGRVKCSLQNSDRDGFAFLSVQVIGALHIPRDSLVVTEDEACNVTCRAVGWVPLPDIAWEVHVPVSQSNFFSFPEDLQSAVSILSLTPKGNGTLTCVATAKGLHANKSDTVNLTVIAPPLGNIDKPGTALPTWAIILLAVSLSLLLILIIILIIIFCCCCVSRREEKESSYQSEIRKSSNVATDKEIIAAKRKSGKENYGYSSDESRTTVISPPPLKSHELRVPEKRSRHLYQGPEEHQPAPSARPHVSFIMTSPKKVRNETLV